MTRGTKNVTPGTGPHLSTYWHEAYITAARAAFPEITAVRKLGVGWKLTRKDGTTTNDYRWPIVDGYRNPPRLHKSPKPDIASGWAEHNPGSCPWWKGDGFCLVTTHAAPASSGGIKLTEGVGHVLVYPVDLARSDEPGKFRVPWCVDVDCFNPIEMIRLGCNVSLTWAGLTRADLTRADLTRADLTRADLTRADLTGADLTGANLRGADLTRASLREADLTRASLREADLTRADLTRANLRWADLTGADLTGAYLRWADLTEAYLTGVRHNQLTIWPAGFEVPK